MADIKKKSILIIGASSFLGSNLARFLRDRYKVFATFYQNPIQIPGVSCFPLNLSEPNWIKRIIYTTQPEVIVYASGKNQIDWAEKNPILSEAFHSSFPGSVLSEADILKCKYIYISNNYVFDGKKGNYTEDNTVMPFTTLGKSKVSGENYIKGRTLHYIIVRSSPVFGIGNGIHETFLDKIRFKLDRGDRIEIPNTEIHGFTPVSQFVEFLSRVIDSAPRKEVFHFGGMNKLSFYDFAKIFAKNFGYDPSLILEKRYNNSAGINTKFQFDYSLNITKSIQNLKIKAVDLEESFEDYRKYLNQKNQRL